MNIPPKSFATLSVNHPRLIPHPNNSLLGVMIIFVLEYMTSNHNSLTIYQNLKIVLIVHYVSQNYRIKTLLS